MSSQPAAGDKRSALNAPDTDDDAGCAEQGEGAEAAGPNPEQAGTRNKKLRRNGEARNLSPLEERKTVKFGHHTADPGDGGTKSRRARLVLGQRFTLTHCRCMSWATRSQCLISKG